MAKFKVIALSLGGLRNRIYSSGDVVTQEQLPVSVDELVEKGFLMPLNAPKAAEVKPVEIEEPNILDMVMESVSEYPPIEEMTIASIKEALGDKAPKKQMPKAELYAMLVG